VLLVPHVTNVSTSYVVNCHVDKCLIDLICTIRTFLFSQLAVNLVCLVFVFIQLKNASSCSRKTKTNNFRYRSRFNYLNISGRSVTASAGHQLSHCLQDVLLRCR